MHQPSHPVTLNLVPAPRTIAEFAARRSNPGWSERLSSWTAEQTLKTALVGAHSGRLRQGYSAVAIRVLLLIDRANHVGRSRPASQFHYLSRRLR